jgi:hypothetical protein
MLYQASLCTITVKLKTFSKEFCTLSIWNWTILKYKFALNRTDHYMKKVVSGLGSASGIIFVPDLDPDLAKKLPGYGSKLWKEKDYISLLFGKADHLVEVALGPVRGHVECERPDDQLAAHQPPPAGGQPRQYHPLSISHKKEELGDSLSESSKPQY